MKEKLVFSLLLVLYSLISTAQLVNVNPDKDEDPWFVGGLRVPSQEEIAKIPILEMPSNSERESFAALPSVLDNSTSTFFRPVFNQADGSCGQASGVGYTFTYEMNRYRGTSANSNINRYPSHFTYNFLNKGSGDEGSWYTDGWNIIKSNGCPNVHQYGGMSISDNYWMSGYDKYEQSMGVRVKDYFAINVGTPAGLETLKYWMFNHLSGEATGGVVNFAAGASDVFTMTNNKIIRWGNTVNHAMTFVGWDDTITYDYNNDGNYTNNVDINNDGVVDMKDWEVGALIMINTWGTYFGNQGKAYVMYKTLAESVGNGGIYMSNVFGIHVEDLVEPKLVMRVKLAHEQRSKIKIFAGLATDVSRNRPQKVVTLPLFAMQGGAHHMRGANNSQPIELSLDVSELLENSNFSDPVKIFLIIRESDSSGVADGQVYDFSIIDRNGVEHVCDVHNESINNNSFTFMSIITSLPLATPEVKRTSANIYPNPTDGIFTIEIEDKIKSVRVFDISGRVVLKANDSQVDISRLNKGIYTLEVTTLKDQVSIQKIIKN